MLRRGAEEFAAHELSYRGKMGWMVRKGVVVLVLLLLLLVLVLLLLLLLLLTLCPGGRHNRGGGN